MKTIIEPFRIKSVEPIRFTSKPERRHLLKKAYYNPFLIHADDVLIDLLTDSGTSAMSSQQWAGIMQGDESYAGSSSYYHFESSVQNLTGMPLVIPTHQGRAAEKIIFHHFGGRGKQVLSNTLFDTTRANVEDSGAEGIDLVCPEAKHPGIPAPFKGNIDLDALENHLKKHAEKVSMVMITITNNSGGGQPVSMENIRSCSALCKTYQVPFFIDACRFAENCYFIKQREPGYAETPVSSIARELFSYADACSMSAKKDAFANIGGFIALRDEAWAEDFRNVLIITEGFSTYGGLAGRDLEAIAIGLKEIVQEDYLDYRIRSIAYMGEQLDQLSIPYLKPTGGHALYLDAAAFMEHIPAEAFPGQALSCALYEQGGVRSVEIGSVMFGKNDAAGNLIPAPLELVRLAIPRRVYTQSHIDYVLEVIAEVHQQRNQYKGFKMVYQAPALRHFTARFEPL